MSETMIINIFLFFGFLSSVLSFLRKDKIGMTFGTILAITTVLYFIGEQNENFKSFFIIESPIFKIILVLFALIVTVAVISNPIKEIISLVDKILKDKKVK